MPKFTLTVVAQRHEDAVSNDDPSVDRRQIGFRMTATLRSERDFRPTLQKKYKLQQFVTDEYWLQERDDTSSDDWGDLPVEKTEWELDPFGVNSSGGEWVSDESETVFTDEPGFLGVGDRHERALSRTRRLGKYVIEFRWKVTKMFGADRGATTEYLLPLTLKASPNDAGVIKYSGTFGGTKTVLTPGVALEESVEFTL
jgi:hypothetical protein